MHLYFQMCIDGYGPAQIAKALRNDNILIPTAYEQSKGKGGARPFRNPTYWGEQTINKMLDRIEYAGHTANFKTKKKSYKNKKKLYNRKIAFMDCYRRINYQAWDPRSAAFYKFDYKEFCEELLSDENAELD